MKINQNGRSKVARSSSHAGVGGSKLVKVGIIGGSGLYEMPQARLIRETSVKTPFGRPSDDIAILEINGVLAAFLPRHGKGHRILPAEINARANIYAFKSLGVEMLIGVGATGSLKEELAPANLIIPEQFVDKTRMRPQTFFGGGIVAHIAFDRPVCPNLASLLSSIGDEQALPVHRGGIYVCMEGPAFSTKAESLEHRRLGYDVVGMTALPEAKLAREAQMCYASLSYITDYDCWKEGEDAVSVEKIIENLREGSARAQRILAQAVPKAALAQWRQERTCRCPEALKAAIVTDPRSINRITAKKLGVILGRRFASTA